MYKKQCITQLVSGNFLIYLNVKHIVEYILPCYLQGNVNVYVKSANLITRVDLLWKMPINAYSQ